MAKCIAEALVIYLTLRDGYIWTGQYWHPLRPGLPPHDELVKRLKELS